MTILKTMPVAAAALILGVFSAGPAFAADYVAKAYPGAKADPKAETSASTTFYTSDPVEKVLAFYGQDAGRAEEAWSDGAYIEYLTADQVSDIYRKKNVLSEAGYATGESKGVTIAAVRLPREGEMPAYSAATMVLAQIDDQYKNWGHSKAELDALHKQYDHLATAMYMLSDKKSSGGVQLDKGRALADAFTDELNSAVTAGAENSAESGAAMADIGAKMQAAMAKGDMAEVQRLAAMMEAPAATLESNSNQMEHADHWDAGVTTLSEMDKIDYRTRIVISKAP